MLTVLKKNGQERQVLERLKSLENSAHQLIMSIESWKATAKELQIEFKALERVRVAEWKCLYARRHGLLNSLAA